jgi:hypothetical protein
VGTDDSDEYTTPIFREESLGEVRFVRFEEGVTKPDSAY